MNEARFACSQVKVAIVNIFTIMKSLLFHNLLNDKYLVGAYYLILFEVYAFALA